MQEKRRFVLKTDVGRQLELLGGRLYKESFLSALKEVIKNSDEMKAELIEIGVDGYEKTEIIEYGGMGINPTKVEDTLGTIFTRSKDEKHFGIGRLGLVLSHSYVDYYTVWEGVIHHWRIFRDGNVAEGVQKPAMDTNWSVKIIGYERKKNNLTIKRIKEYLEEYLGLRLYHGLSIRLNGTPLKSPLTNPNVREYEFYIGNKKCKFVAFWELSSKGNFSIVCENGIGVRKKPITGITIYFDQNGYLETKLDREDFQRNANLIKFLNKMRGVLKEIVPREKPSEETIKELWGRIFPMIRFSYYNAIGAMANKKIRKRERTKRNKGKTIKPVGTRRIEISKEYDAPWLWYDNERQLFVINITHPITILLAKKYRSRSGRLDVLALPLARCYFLVQAISMESKTNWDYLKEHTIKSDKRLGIQLKKALRKHRSTEETID